MQESLWLEAGIQSICALSGTNDALPSYHCMPPLRCLRSRPQLTKLFPITIQLSVRHTLVHFDNLFKHAVDLPGRWQFSISDCRTPPQRNKLNLAQSWRTSRDLKLAPSDFLDVAIGLSHGHWIWVARPYGWYPFTKGHPPKTRAPKSNTHTHT